MAISDQLPREIYTGNASNVTAYTVTYPFYEASELVVCIIEANGEIGDPLTLNSDYTVTGGDGSTGSIVTTAAVVNTKQVRIDRTLPLSQEAAFTDAGRFPSASVDRALDRLTMQVQQIDRDVTEFTSTIDGGHA